MGQASKENRLRISFWFMLSIWVRVNDYRLCVRVKIDDKAILYDAIFASNFTKKQTIRILSKRLADRAYLFQF